MKKAVLVFGVIAGLLCMGLLFSDGLNRNFVLSDLFIALTVPLGYALSNTLIKKNFSQMNPVILTGLFLSISSFFLIPLSVMFETITTLQVSALIGILGSVLLVQWNTLRGQFKVS